MEINTERLFGSRAGRAVYDRALEAVKDYSMSERLSEGVLVGLSGGADSVLLCAFLCEYRRSLSLSFPIVAVHINHGIRGDEALRDAEFSREVAAALGIDFLCVDIDVPALALGSGLGIEEAARNARYSCFEDIISGRNKRMCIAVAHNATDNLETVLFNVLRGAGTRGVRGIPAVRDNIIRPLIYIPKSDIVNLLSEAGVGFVTDSTNEESDYTRNYIRNEVLPLLRKINATAEDAVCRLSRVSEWDSDYLETEAARIVGEYRGGAIPREKLISLHPAILSRVIILLAQRAGGGCEFSHVESIRELLAVGEFSLSLPGKIRFVAEGGLCRIEPDTPRESFTELSVPLKYGRNIISPLDLVVEIGEEPDNSSNVYNFSIQTTISSDIIDNGFCVRFKRDGDAYRYGNMTHKLKKVFNDKGIHPSKRDRVPVFEDRDGIVYVPGLPLRDGAVGKVRLLVGVTRQEGRIPVYFATPERKD
ncbi:MAG: tRNA lysidine(34) synthetase TilS [Clostridia bacterium]|nr:tRNA lysidine(34) synthetase TilS [Clostridia bacterium]